jgi:hypothetical protein
VYAHYAECIPARMTAANADSLATLQKLREEISLLAKTMETCHGSITRQAEKTNELCRTTQARCHDAVVGIETAVKRITTQVDTKAIVAGVQNTLETGINREVIAPFLQQTEKLARQVVPTLKQIQESAEAARLLWVQRIWRTAWANSMLWSFSFTLLGIAFGCWKIEAYFEHKMAGQIASTAQVMQFNQEAFRQLAITQIPIEVLPTQDDGEDGFVLVMKNADSTDMRQLGGQRHGCIFFRSQVPQKQLRHLQQDLEHQGQNNNTAK